eukprot:5940717-Ditylum_brightwellii.AAC.1
MGYHCNRRIGPTEQEVTLIPLSSAICDEEADFATSVQVLLGGEETPLTLSILEDSQTRCLSSHGLYSIVFTLMDINGH